MAIDSFEILHSGPLSYCKMNVLASKPSKLKPKHSIFNHFQRPNNCIEGGKK